MKQKSRSYSDRHFNIYIEALFQREYGLPSKHNLYSLHTVNSYGFTYFLEFPVAPLWLCLNGINGNKIPFSGLSLNIHNAGIHTVVIMQFYLLSLWLQFLLK